MDDVELRTPRNHTQFQHLLSLLGGMVPSHALCPISIVAILLSNGISPWNQDTIHMYSSSNDLVGMVQLACTQDMANT